MKWREVLFAFLVSLLIIQFGEYILPLKRPHCTLNMDLSYKKRWRKTFNCTLKAMHVKHLKLHIKYLNVINFFGALSKFYPV